MPNIINGIIFRVFFMIPVLSCLITHLSANPTGPLKRIGFSCRHNSQMVLFYDANHARLLGMFHHRTFDPYETEKRLIMNDWILINADNLPTLPHVATQLLAVIGDPLRTETDFESIIQVDYAITQRLLTLANSEAQSTGGSQVIDIKAAIQAIGMNKVRNLAFMAATKDVDNTRVQTTIDLWIHSLAVALAAQTLAEQAGLSDVAEYYIAGMFHDIGKILLNHQKPERYGQLINCARQDKLSWAAMERETFKFTHEEVGVLIMQKWHFPESLLMPVKYHHLIQQDDCESIPEETLTAIVATADMIANMLSYGLVTSVTNDPFSARSVQILKLPQDAILYVMEVLPQKIQAVLDQFRITTVMSSFQAHH